MTVLTRKFSKLRFVAVVRLVLALFVVVFGAGAMLAQTNQVSFTATATGSITGVTKLPGRLTRINFNGSGILLFILLALPPLIHSDSASRLG
jgi:hypothetical protein